MFSIEILWRRGLTVVFSELSFKKSEQRILQPDQEALRSSSSLQRPESLDAEKTEIDEVE